MRHAKQYKRGSRGKAAVFFVALFAFGIFSLLLPPAAHHLGGGAPGPDEIPEFSVETLADGEYTSGIDAWFADTFPLRDIFFSLNNWVKSFSTAFAP